MGSKYLRRKIAILLSLAIVAASPFSIAASETEAVVPGISADSFELIRSVNETISGDASGSGNRSGSENGSESGNGSVSGNSRNGISGDTAPSENKTVSGDNSPSINKPAHNFSKPFVFLTKKKIVLNGMRRSVSGVTYLVLNTGGEYEVRGLESRAGIGISYNRVSYNSFPAWMISAESTKNTEKGSIRFDISIREKETGAESNRVKLIVSVQKKDPPVKWKKPVVYLNRGVKGEFALNSPDVEGVSIVPVDSDEYRSKIPKGINISLQNENTVKIEADPELETGKKYPVQLWLLYSDSTSLKAVKKKFNVMLTDSSAVVTLKRANDSSLDLSARKGTALHYRPVVKNTGMVVDEMLFRSRSLSLDYILQEVRDPDTGEVTDIYISASENSALRKGISEFDLDTLLQNPRMDTKKVKAISTVRASKKSSKIRLAFISGNILKEFRNISDNKLWGAMDLRVASPKFARLDPSRISELTYDSGKVPPGAFESAWKLDTFGQAARIEVKIDRSKLISGKTYNLIYSLKALGADGNTAPTRVTLKVKIP